MWRCRGGSGGGGNGGGKREVERRCFGDNTGKGLGLGSGSGSGWREGASKRGTRPSSRSCWEKMVMVWCPTPTDNHA